MATSQTLRAVIDAGRTSKRLDELSTARVLGKIAEQTHAAQQKAGAGKAIGPITPSSISIEESGAAKLGLAEPAALAYSSPEQITGDPGDRRSDVFALGIVMWEALTHERLFDGSDGEIMAAVMTKPIASPFELNANVPAELGVICMKALSRNPSERYQSAKVMAAEIEAVLDDAGYADTDERIAEYMTELGKPQNLPKVTLITPPHGVSASAPIVVAAAPAPEPMKLPSILDKAPTEPPAKMMAPSAGSLSPMSFSKPPTQPPPILNPMGQPVKLNDTLPSLGAPLPPVLPAKPAASMELPKATPAATVHGFAAAEPRSSDPSMDAVTTPFVPVEPSAAQSDPVLLTTPKSPTLPEPSKPAVLADDPHRITQVAQAAPINNAPIVVSAKELSGPSRKRDLTPHPASIVALPMARESQEVLGGWGWGTDSHPALAEFNEYEDEASPAAASRKTLLYVIGGGLAVAAIVTIIAVGFGSSSPPKRVPPQPAAAVQEGSAGSAVAEVGSAIGSAAGSAVVPEVVPAPDAAEVAVVTPDATVAEVAPPPPIDAAAAPVVVAPPPPPPPPVVTQKPKPKPATPKPIDPYATSKPHRADPPRVAHAEPKPPHNASSAEVEAAYKQGLQLYLKGDTQGALASLRIALAGNANYPPTWRGLGLVFEKMGEKDQARAAYRRYLALAPSAGDAESIRGRLERLGP